LTITASTGGDNNQKESSMTPKEQESAITLARIMRAARKQAGMGQQEVAKKLGISQSALSKHENGLLILSAPHWYDFCQITGITPESFLSGCIERNRFSWLEEGSRVGDFKIPKKYASKRGSKVRAMLPFLRYLNACLGEKKEQEYFKTLKIDPDYFVDLDNQLNLEFLLDVSRFLIQQGHLKPGNIDKLVESIGGPSAHGSLHSGYAGIKNRAELLTRLLTNARRYECNFNYAIEDQKPQYIVFSVTPEKHLEAMSYRNDPVLGDFLCQYKQQYFEQFVQYGESNPQKRALITELECHYKGAPKCTYKLKTA
jgi:transcriptional regulator with XRE-family HTH domain